MRRRSGGVITSEYYMHIKGAQGNGIITFTHYMHKAVRGLTFKCLNFYFKSSFTGVGNQPQVSES